MANSNPPLAPPPSGCPPTKTVFCGSLAAASTMARFVPPTSVTNARSRHMRCNLAEQRQVLPDRCGEDHQIRTGNGRQI